MNLAFDGVKVEADFVAWRRPERRETGAPPQLLLGEAKSMGQGDLIKPNDLQKLRKIGQKLSGATLVVSVLRERFSLSEIKLLKSFVQWGRRPDRDGRPSNPILLLTGNELFTEHYIRETWKKLGPLYKPFTGYEHTRNLDSFCDATQQIYLGLPPIHEQRTAEWEKKAARKQKLRN
jgi:hypothetical protein